MGRKAAEEYATAGPLSKLFMSPVARVLDQAMIVGNLETTVAILAESTNLTYKTVQGIIIHIMKWSFIRRGRKLGNAQTYRFDMEKLRPLLAVAERMKLPRR